MKLRGKVWLTVCILTVVVVVATSFQAAAQDSQREFVYTINFGNRNISGFSLSLENGKARQVPGSPLGAGVGPVSMTHSPDGRFVYVVDNLQFLDGPCGDNNGELLSFSVNLRTGALTQIDDVVLSGICSSGVAVDPTGRFVYAASFPFDFPKVGIIDGFETSNGHLTPIPGTPFASTIEVAAGQNPAIDDLAIPPDGKVLYASNENDTRGILIFDRDTETGALTFREGVNTGSAFVPFAITPSGRFLLAPRDIPSSGQPGIFEFAIGDHGDLTPVPGSPFPLPPRSGSAVAVSPDGELVAVLGEGVSTLHENESGNLSLVHGSPFEGITGLDITFDPTGRFVLVPGTVFRVHPRGAVTRVAEFPEGSGAQAVTVVRTCLNSADEDRDDKGKHEQDRDDRQDGGCYERHD